MAMTSSVATPIADSLRVACVQMCARNDPQDNLRRVLEGIGEAVRAGAQLVALPEAIDYLDEHFDNARAYAQPAASHQTLMALRAATRELACWLLIGSLTVRDGDGQLVNRSFLVSPDGTSVCHYDKIHLFDALPGASSFTESQLYKRGEFARVPATPWGTLGMSICYDVRFPHLYRALAQAGAAIIAIPAAFMKVTGEAHWHALIRARAIETGCFILAPAQCGHHYGERHSYGHSLIVDPWGRVLADGGEAPGIVVADLDLSLVANSRARIPSLHQDKQFGWEPQA